MEQASVTRTRRPRGREAARIAATLLALGAAACATMGQMLGVQEPTFAFITNRPSTLRLGAPTIKHPRGTATVRLWTLVTNPNPFGLTLTELDGTLGLEGQDVLDVELPLGLPMSAASDTIIPIDFTFGFESFDALGAVATRMLTRDALSYELAGTIGVRAGPLGEPRFGPRTWLQGSLELENPLRAVP